MQAFVAAAERRHFGRAARSLFLSQQALSKRIARLEEQVGVLFDRAHAGVSLTERGQRLLPAAHHLLEVAEQVLATARGQAAPLRVDVWGSFDPLDSTVRAFAAEHPGSVVEVSMRRNFVAALDALRRNELDVALGNVANLDARIPDGLSSALVALSALAGLVNELGGLADATVIGPEDLGGHGLCLPPEASRRELAQFVIEYAEAVDAPLSSDSRSTGFAGMVDRIAADPRVVTLVPAGWPVPEGAGLLVVPIRPVPLLPWYAVHKTASPHPLVPRLVRALRETGGLADWERSEHWMPAGARDAARQEPRSPAPTGAFPHPGRRPGCATE